MSANKPGNVSPYHNFLDTKYEHFLASSVVVGDGMRKLVEEEYGIGEAILATVGESMKSQSGGNVHLGTIILFAPIAQAAKTSKLNEIELRIKLGDIINSCSVQDAICVYKAIRKAGLLGLTSVKELDVRDVNTLEEIKRREVRLKDWMAVGAKENSVCFEYITNYELSFEIGLPILMKHFGRNTNESIVQIYLTFLAHRVDTMILGKYGRRAAEWVKKKAMNILDAGGIRTKKGKNMIRSFDDEMRAKNMNPGTSADLVASTLFIALLCGLTV